MNETAIAAAILRAHRRGELAILKRRVAISSGARQARRLRRDAERLEQLGRNADAIGVWMALNSLEADPLIEEHLVDLRCAAATSATSEATMTDWPPSSSDPFPAVSGRPPELDAHELSAEYLAGAISHHGCLIVRALVPADTAAALCTTADELFAARHRNRGRVPVAAPPWYRPCRAWDERDPKHASVLRAYNEACNAVHVVDSPRGLALAAGAVEMSGVGAVIADYLGEEPVFSADKLLLRRVPPTAKPSWHQDGSFMGQRTRAVNVWVALNDCGEGTGAAGIAIIPRRLSHSVRGETFDITLRSDELESAAGDVEAIVPTMHAGDALLFDELFLHANGGNRPGLTRDRYALEAWMFAPSSMPDYMPVLMSSVLPTARS